MGREFEIRRDVEIPGTPEQVWEAVATAPGNASWLFPNEIEGEPIKVWDPPHRLVVRTEGEGGWFNAIEFILEGRAGGTTALRYVHSGIFDDEGWDDQYDAVNQHTDFYLHTLGQYVAHFSPRTATYVGDVPGGIDGPEASAGPDGFARLKSALGLDRAGEGDTVQADLNGGSLDGVVDYLRGNFAGIRTADGLYRFFGRNAFGGPVGVVLHSFADGVDADAARADLKRWLDGVYA